MVSSSVETDSPVLRAKREQESRAASAAVGTPDHFHSLGSPAAPDAACDAAAVGGFAIASAAMKRQSSTASTDVREPYVTKEPYATKEPYVSNISAGAVGGRISTSAMAGSYAGSSYTRDILASHAIKREEILKQVDYHKQSLEQAAVDQAKAAMQATAVNAKAESPDMALPGAKFSRQETFIIFDWDDTLLPSYWIASNGLRLEAEYVIDPASMAKLAQIEKLAEQLLIKASRHGQVCLITNAETGWIELSCRKYMPGLAHELFSGKYIIRSARSEYEKCSPPDLNTPFGWKVQSFKKETQRYFDNYSLKPGKQRTIVSFGDSAHEREALLKIAQEFGQTQYVCKTVKFMERPRIDTLQTQQKMMLGSLDRIIQMPQALDLQIKAPRAGEQGSTS